MHIDHCTLITATGKVPNGVRWKNLLRRYLVRRRCNSFPGAGEGI
jgi:hypothetical protein